MDDGGVGIFFIVLFECSFSVKITRATYFENDIVFFFCCIKVLSNTTGGALLHYWVLIVVMLYN